MPGSLFESLCLRHATLLKNRLWHRCFLVNFVKFLRTPFLNNTSGGLLLHTEILGSILRLISFEQHFNCFWSYSLIIQHYGLFVEFPWFRGFRLWVQGSKWKPQNHRISLFFGFIKLKCMSICFFEHYFNSLSIRTNRTKRDSKAVKTQIPAIWLVLWLNNFEFEQHFNCFWSYVLIFQYYGVSVEFPWFPIFRLRLKMKTRKLRKTFVFWIYKAQINVSAFLFIFWVKLK